MIMELVAGEALGMLRALGKVLTSADYFSDEVIDFTVAFGILDIV